jgi:hypothetical protein
MITNVSSLARTLGLLAALATVCCGSAGGQDKGLLGPTSPGGEDDGGVFDRADAAAAAFDAYIKVGQVAITFVTLGCSNGCADVEAVPTGGTAPYTFAWSDGATGATRHVCPASTSTFHVDVTDAATTGEFPTPAETVGASLTANVIACPEAGLPGAGVSNCTPILTVSPPSGTVSGTGAESCTSGSTSSLSAFSATASLKKGETYTIKQDVTGTVLAGRASWNIYGSAARCASPPGGQLLGTLTFDPSATTNSFCFTAADDYSAIDWEFTSVAAGVGQGVYSLCNGCAQ